MISCFREECLWNKNKICSRDEILVDKLQVGDKLLWVCKCFSKEGIKGHTDWFSRLCNPDGTAKGGSVSDSEAEKIYKDRQKFKSFSSWHKEGEVTKRRK